MTKTDKRFIQRFIENTYVQRSDERQKAMGLKYTEAETTDLAEQFSRYMRAGLVRYCPQCSHIGPAIARECCPDGSSESEYVPLPIAQQARRGFQK